MSLPNRLTIFRIFLTVVFVFLLTQNGIAAKVMAVIVFVMASLTDFYDGYYAKKHNLVTDFGKLMDPIADKFLILAAFFVFMSMRLIAPWMFAVILIREVTVTAARLQAMRQGRILAAEPAGKVKTVFQIAAVFAILFFTIFVELTMKFHWPSSLIIPLYQGIRLLMSAVAAITFFSGLSFLWNNRRFLHAAKNPG